MYQIGDIVFRDWEIVRKIGRGASGAVYEIRKENGSVALSGALKVMYVPQDDSALEDLTNDGLDKETASSYFQEIVSELEEEIKLMVQMKGAPNIVSCEDYSISQDPKTLRWQVLIRMELLQPLSNWQKDHDMTESDVQKLGLQMAYALQLLEKQGIIHRDIKPENIFVTPYGNYKLGDFGIARVSDKTSGMFSRKGTEKYMAPEVYIASSYDSTVDIYSLGLVLYRLLNKNRLPFYPIDRPYTGAEKERAEMDRISGMKIMPAPCMASPAFARVVLRMCAYDPKDRYQSADELMKDLENVPAGNRVTAPATVSSEIEMHKSITGKPVVDKSEDDHMTRGVFGYGAEHRSVSEKTEVIRVDRPKKTGNSKSISNGNNDGIDTIDSEKSGSTVNHSDSSKASEQSRPVRRDYSQDAKKGAARKESSLKKKLIVLIAVLGIVSAIIITVVRRWKFSVNVNDGSGSGKYTIGEEVTITADKKDGETFTNWDVSGITLTSEEASRETLTFKMKPSDITFTAKYTENEYKATVENGSGSGNYSLDDVVEISADPAPEGYQFIKWVVKSGGITVDDPEGMETSFRMPDNEVKVKAQYEPVTYHLEVYGAEASGDYTFGETIIITANEKDSYTFGGWSVESGPLSLSKDEIKSDRLTITMPAGDVTIAALYEKNVHNASILHGTGSGKYETGALVEIEAEEPEDGMSFVSWKLLKGKPELEDKTLKETQFYMPDNDVSVEAEYEPNIYQLTVTEAEGTGDYKYGEEITLTAAGKEGCTFTGWNIVEGELSLGEDALGSERLVFNMPANDLSITAVYANTLPEYFVSPQNGAALYNSASKSVAAGIILPYGTGINVIAREGEWCQIIYNGSEYWIQSKHLIRYEYTATAYEVSEDTIDYNGVLVHESPSFESNVSVRIPVGTVLISSDVQAGFLHIAYSGVDNETGTIVTNITGYVALRWLNAIE